MRFKVDFLMGEKRKVYQDFIDNGVCYRTIKSLYDNNAKTIKIDILEKVADILGVTFIELFDVEDYEIKEAYENGYKQAVDDTKRKIIEFLE